MNIHSSTTKTHSPITFTISIKRAKTGRCSLLDDNFRQATVFEHYFDKFTRNVTPTFLLVNNTQSNNLLSGREQHVPSFLRVCSCQNRLFRSPSLSAPILRRLSSVKYGSIGGTSSELKIRSYLLCTFTVTDTLNHRITFQ